MIGDLVWWKISYIVSSFSTSTFIKKGHSNFARAYLLSSRMVIYGVILMLVSTGSIDVFLTTMCLNVISVVASLSIKSTCALGSLLSVMSYSMLGLTIHGLWKGTSLLSGLHSGSGMGVKTSLLFVTQRFMVMRELSMLSSWNEFAKSCLTQVWVRRSAL